MGNFKGVVTVFLISLSSWPLLFSLTKFPQLTKPSVLLPVGSIILLVTTWIISTFLGNVSKQAKINKYSNINIIPRGIIYYTCALFSWTCMVDVVLFLEAIGSINGFMGFYLETGERYFNTPYGIVALLLDFVLNLPLFLTIIYKIDNNLDCRNVVIYYGASNLSSVTCLLLGALSGNYGKEVLPSTWLNLPYFILPTYFLLQFLTQPRHLKSANLNQSSIPERGLLNYLLGLGMIFSFVFGIIQGLAAVNSPLPIAQWYLQHEPYLLEPNKFGAVWPIYSMFCVSYLRITIFYGLFFKSAHWMKDWILVYLATMFDGVTKHLCSQFFRRLNSDYHIPPDSIKLVVISNLIPFLVALAIFYKVFSNNTCSKIKQR